jgi:hypothetical protein
MLLSQYWSWRCAPAKYMNLQCPTPKFAFYLTHVLGDKEINGRGRIRARRLLKHDLGDLSMRADQGVSCSCRRCTVRTSMQVSINQRLPFLSMTLNCSSQVTLLSSLDALVAHWSPHATRPRWTSRSRLSPSAAAEPRILWSLGEIKRHASSKVVPTQKPPVAEPGILWSLGEIKRHASSKVAPNADTWFYVH